MSASSFPGNLRATPRTTLFRSSFYQCAPCHLSPKQIAYIIYCYVRVVRRKISNQLKSTELKIMDTNQILNLCSFRAADAATPQWEGLLQLSFQILQSKTIEQPFFSFLSRKVYRFVAIVVIRGGGEGEKIGFIAKPTTNQPNPTSEDASENLKLLLFYSSHVAVCLYTMSQLVGCTAHWTVQNDWPKIQW